MLIISNQIININAQDTQLYPVKSGMIKYVFKGRTNGVETIYFDDYGKLISDLKTTEIVSNGNIIEESVLSIFKHDTIFELNMSNNTVSIVQSANQPIISKLISNEMLEMLDYSKSGNEEIAGIVCIKYSGKNGNLWVWNNIVLKSEMEIMGTKIISEATKIITGIDISKSKFDIPKN